MNYSGIESRRTSERLLPLITAMLAAAAALVAVTKVPFTSIMQVHYGFGPTVASILFQHRFGMQEAHGGYWAYARRMPFIPLFLAAVATVSRKLTLVFLVKDILYAGLWYYSLWRLIHFLRLPIRVAYVLTAFVYLVPFNVEVVSQIDFEESYIFFLLAALAAIALTRSASDYWKIALLTAASYLTKSSLGLVCLVVTLWTVLQDHRGPGLRRASFLPLLAFVLSVVGWGAYIYHQTGVFAAGVNASSWNGWNFYKGNNPEAVQRYPRINLDTLDENRSLQAPPSVPIHNEWDEDRWQLKQGNDFIRAHPSEVIAMDLMKLKVLFYDIKDSPQAKHGVNQLLAPFALLLDHFMFTLALGFALWRRRADSIFFLLMVSAYVVPFIAGFLYQRHMIPLYGLAFIYCGVGLAGLRENIESRSPVAAAAEHPAMPRQNKRFQVLHREHLQPVNIGKKSPR
jgi:hypothetical protein